MHLYVGQRGKKLPLSMGGQNARTRSRLVPVGPGRSRQVQLAQTGPSMSRL